MEPLTKTITELIGNLGFPIAIAAYVLLRLDKQMRCMVKGLAELRGDLRAHHESRPR